MTSMKKFSKSRYFLPLLLIVMLLVSGTLAYVLTHTQEVINVFKPSKVTITIEEDFDGTTKSNVVVKNEDFTDRTDEVDVYVRVMLIHNWYRDAKTEAGEVVQQLAGKNNWTITEANVANINTSDWFYNEADNFYYYKKVLPVGEQTTPLINSIKLLIDETDETYQGLEIVAEGIQALPADAVTEAWGVTVNIDGTIEQ